MSQNGLCKIIRTLWVAVFLLLGPAPAFSHHISMSFSDWELSEDGAAAVFRFPFSDAVWLMDPSLVKKTEASIQIKANVDEVLRSRVDAYIRRTIPQKVNLKGCDFIPDSLSIAVENATVQMRTRLSCTPGYLEDLELTNQFLVDENQLHTSLATLHFPDRVQQCIFRSSQFTCGGKTGSPPAEKGPAWQAQIAPWWDYLMLGVIIILLAGSNRAVGIALTALTGAHALAVVCSHFNLPVPSMEILRTVLSVIPVYAGLAIYTGSKGKPGWTWFFLGHAAAFLFSWAGLIRLTPVMVIWLSLMGAGVMASGHSANEKSVSGDKSHEATLYLLSFIFGLIHSFILLRYRFQYSLPDLITPFVFPLIIVAAFLLLFRMFRQHLQQPGKKTTAAVILAAAGLVVFLLRNINLPFSAFEYQNAQALISDMIRSREISGSLLPLLLIAAAVIGGLHALTPGHGKTIVAAYLVGTRGRVRDAFVLGIIVTFTHTFSVIVLAVIALFASHHILADQLVPVLTGFSGLLICLIGIYLFQLRLKNFIRRAPHHHDFSHDPPNPDHRWDHHSDHHHDHVHSHDGISHAHVLPDSSKVSLGSLIALGISGGIVPCPDALAILLLAISMGRIGFGLSVIIVFSLGLAAVLIAIGIAMVKARPLVEQFTGQGRFINLWLPLVSAVLVTLLGVIVLWKAWPGL